MQMSSFHVPRFDAHSASSVLGSYSTRDHCKRADAAKLLNVDVCTLSESKDGNGELLVCSVTTPTSARRMQLCSTGALNQTRGFISRSVHAGRTPRRGSQGREAPECLPGCSVTRSRGALGQQPPRHGEAPEHTHAHRKSKEKSDRVHARSAPLPSRRPHARARPRAAYAPGVRQKLRQAQFGSVQRLVIAAVCGVATFHGEETFVVVRSVSRSVSTRARARMRAERTRAGAREWAPARRARGRAA